MEQIPLEKIYKILESGGQAPSGSNSQPWKFVITGNKVEILAFPEKDHPILNYRCRGTWVAHGALIENLLIAASALGYKTDLELFSLSPTSRVTAEITFTEDVIQKDGMFDAIIKRATNRKPYANTPLTKEQKDGLYTEAKKVGSGEFLIVEDPEKIKVLAKASSMNEVILLEEPAMHKLFFEEIVWTEKEEKEKRTGLYLKTMELEAPQEKVLKLFKNWRIMRFMNHFGVAKGIAKTNEKSYANSPAVAAIIINDTDDEFLSAGRIMERVWLKATSMGLSCHLMTGILFFWQRIKNENDNAFSEKHRALIAKAYEEIAKTLGLKGSDKTISLLIRIGHGGEPSGFSSRISINQISKVT
jgi:nitroreductase